LRCCSPPTCRSSASRARSAACTAPCSSGWSRASARSASCLVRAPARCAAALAATLPASGISADGYQGSLNDKCKQATPNAAQVTHKQLRALANVSKVRRQAGRVVAGPTEARGFCRCTTGCAAASSRCGWTRPARGSSTSWTTRPCGVARSTTPPTGSWPASSSGAWTWTTCRCVLMRAPRPPAPSPRAADGRPGPAAPHARQRDERGVPRRRPETRPSGTGGERRPGLNRIRHSCRICDTTAASTFCSNASNFSFDSHVA